MEKKKPIHPDIKGLLTLTVSFLLLLCLLSFVHGSPKENWIGIVGYGIGFTFLYLFGLCSYVIAIYVGWRGWKLLTRPPAPRSRLKILYFAIALLSLAILLNVYAESGYLASPFIETHTYSEIYLSSYPFPHKVVRFNLGGAPLYYLYRDLQTFNLQHLLSNLGVVITFSITGLMSLILITNIRVIPLTEQLGHLLKSVGKFLRSVAKDLTPKRRRVKPIPPEIIHSSISAPPPQARPMAALEPSDLKISTHLEKPAVSGRSRSPSAPSYKGAYKRFRLPPLKPAHRCKEVGPAHLEKRAEEPGNDSGRDAPQFWHRS